MTEGEVEEIEIVVVITNQTITRRRKPAMRRLRGVAAAVPVAKVAGRQFKRNRCPKEMPVKGAEETDVANVAAEIGVKMAKMAEITAKLASLPLVSLCSISWRTRSLVLLPQATKQMQMLTNESTTGQPMEDASPSPGQEEVGLKNQTTNEVKGAKIVANRVSSNKAASNVTVYQGKIRKAVVTAAVLTETMIRFQAVSKSNEEANVVK